MIVKAAAALFAVLLGWAYRAIQPPPPRICGTPDGPPVTSKRIRLRDGRHLAYKETGTPKDEAKYKIIHVHGFDGSKDYAMPASPVEFTKQSPSSNCSLTAVLMITFCVHFFQKLIDELGVYILSFDRAGYGESDPNPKRTVRSEAMDIEELADQLELGSKFYVVGVSMGGYPTWSCLNYIPHRLAGAALVVPAVSYWWPSFPPDLVKRVFSSLLVEDRRTLWIAHHVPSLLYGWMTQKWLPTLAIARGSPQVFTQQDLEIIQKLGAYLQSLGYESKARQQGIFESLYKDLIVMFGSWEFDPMNITDPFPNKESSVHIWQGYEDKLVPVELQRYVAERLPWIHYHENPEGGHMFPFDEHWSDTILRALLLGEEQHSAT